MIKPTMKQRRFIRRQRLKPARTKQSASRLITFLLENGNVGERTRQLREIYERWRKGVRVRVVQHNHDLKGREGVVRGLRIRSEAELARIHHRHPQAQPHPYVALIAFEGMEKRRYLPLSAIIRIDPRRQQTFDFSTGT